MPFRKPKPINPRAFAKFVSGVIERRAGKRYRHSMGANKNWMHPKVEFELRERAKKRLFDGFPIKQEILEKMVMKDDFDAIVNELMVKEGHSYKIARHKAVELLEEVNRRYNEFFYVAEKIDSLDMPQYKKDLTRDAIAHITTAGIHAFIMLRKLERS